MLVDQEKKEAIRTYGAAVRSGGIVTVEVGPKRDKYPLHKAVIAQHSEYFAQALNGSSQDDDKLMLEHVEPGIFNIFVDFVYGLGTPMGCDYKRWVEVTEQEIASPATDEKPLAVDVAHITAICLAKRLIAPQLERVLHNEYVDFELEYRQPVGPAYTSVICAYDNLPKDHPLLRLLVDLQSYFWCNTMDTEENGNLQLFQALPNEYTRCVMTKMAQIRDRRDTKVHLCPCDYHIHDEKTICPYSDGLLSHDDGEADYETESDV
ncbi:hypothetical protein PMIN07_005209 [Paraphaeosphaeria minitans]|uniref:BTB domain-containing protein n=1 Tax=Paraphaeosphaeria minitans TaxID=565426 RepID=A0A9P6GN51_9PLEO|nr:hypothetical protein PMIN01_03721 [Paraphaeosphaeria minitans]